MITALWKWLCRLIWVSDKPNASIYTVGRSQWPRGLRRRSKTVRLLGSWVRIPPGAWTFVCCECCVLSGRGHCDELAPRPGKFYRLWCVVVCKFETSWMRSQNKAGWTVGRRLQQTDNVAVQVRVKYLVSLQRLGGIVNKRKKENLHGRSTPLRNISTVEPDHTS